MPDTTTPKENNITYGLKDLVIFFEGDSEKDEPGIYIDSIIKYERTMNVSKSDLHANDSLFCRITDEKNGDGIMELANLPKAVQARMLGWRIDSKGGLVHVKDGKPERFDMCYSVSGDKYMRRKFVYGCEASVDTDNNETRGENVNFRTEKATITEYGVTKNGEHVWDYLIYEAEDPDGFAASMKSVVYPQPVSSGSDQADAQPASAPAYVPAGTPSSDDGEA